MISSIPALSFLPFSAILELTYKCNHQCVFCYCPWEAPEKVYRKGKELSVAEWNNCIHQLIEMGVTNFTYTGGEPILKKGFKEIIKYTASLKATHINKDLQKEIISPNQHLISNGQLLDEELFSFIKEYNVSLSLSLPGLKKYKAHTGKNNPDIVLNNIRKAKENDIQISVNITVTKLNIDELFEILSNALFAGANSVLLNRFLPGGRGMNYLDELVLNKDEVVYMLMTADEVLQKANRIGILGTGLPKCLTKDLKLSNLNLSTQCTAAKNFFVIGPEGNIRVCNHSPVQLESYKEIKKLKDNHYWKTFVNKQYSPIGCVNCNEKYNCDGGCREAACYTSGNLKGNDIIFN